jgi:hypothetical protein
MVETWWESLEGIEKAFASLNTTMLPSGLSVSDDFSCRVVGYTSCDLEEFTVLNELQGDAIKRMTFYSLKEGIDGDEFFDYHTKVHAVDVMNASRAPYSRKKYVINRVKEVVKGNERFYGFIETWWKNRSHMEQDLSDLGRVRLSKGKALVEDFFDRVRDVVVYEVTEFLAGP